MISSTLYFLSIQLNYHFPYRLFKSDWFAVGFIVKKVKKKKVKLLLYSYGEWGLAPPVLT